jgi:hypothetical protein
MPRPKDGYRNRADQPIPGVHDITGRYKETGGLLNWAYSQGKKGVPLYQQNVLQIGHAVHRMAELDLRRAPKRIIEIIGSASRNTTGRQRSHTLRCRSAAGRADIRD